MTRVGSSGPLILVFLLVASVPLAAAESERVLFAQLPLELDGDVTADAQGAIMRLAARDGVAPRVTQADVRFTAVRATAHIYNWTQYDTPTEGTPVPTDLVYPDTGGSTKQEYGPIEVRLAELGPEALIMAHDGPMEGAAYHAMIEDQKARLDVTTERSVLSYTEQPKNLDYDKRVDEGTFVLSGQNLVYHVRGDFELFVFDTTLQVVTEGDQAAGATIKTGRWSESQDGDGVLPGEAAVTRTTIQYVRLFLEDAEFSLRASGGEQGLYAGSEEMAIAVDGSISTPGAVGSMSINEQTVRSKGERARLSGTFTLVPMASETGDDRWGFFALTGEITTLSVGRTTYASESSMVAATGLAMLLAGAAIYFLPVLKTGLFLPLYAKLSKDKVLDQETRNNVHAKVEQDPGCQVNDIADSLAISWTTASYHLRVLRKMGLVVSRRRGRHEHFFVPGARETASYDIVGSLKNDTARHIVEEVLRHPGIIQKELCERLAIAPSTASWHLKRLIQSNAITEARDWKMRRYYAGAALSQVPIHVGPVHDQQADVLVASG